MRFQGGVSAATLIEGRYVFKAVMDFSISSNCDDVVFSRGRFHFAEVSKVIVPPGGAVEGGISVIFHQDQRWLNGVDWKRLVGSDWNFSALGIEVRSNAPVRNIESAIPVL
jgi:hypothetical protein